MPQYPPSQADLEAEALYCLKTSDPQSFRRLSLAERKAAATSMADQTRHAAEVQISQGVQESAAWPSAMRQYLAQVAPD